jgi:hypothetical protein
MLLSEAITMTLQRTGLSTTNTANINQARLYLNSIANRIVGRAEWWWLFKSATLTTVANQRIYSLAADVQVPYSFTDQTNGQNLPLKGWDFFDAVDPEQDETGDVDVVTIEGIDATTGRIVVALYPKHSTVSETIRYRYLAYIPDWVSSNDTDNLDIHMPQILQPALYFGAAELYMQEKGDSEGAGENRDEYSSIIDIGLKTNLRIWGNRRWRRRGDEDNGIGGFEFFVQEGSLSA